MEDKGKEECAMYKEDFSIDDYGFNDRSDACWLRFARRYDGSLTCRLELSKSVSDVVGNRLGCYVDDFGHVDGIRVSVATDQHGNILVRLGKGDFTASLGNCVSIPLDRHARELSNLHDGCEAVKYDHFILSGDYMVVLSPSSCNPTR